MNEIDFSSWYWTFTNTSGCTITLTDGSVIAPGETHVFQGSAPDSAAGAEQFLDSFNGLESQVPPGTVVMIPEVEEALRQASKQAKAYDDGQKRLIVTPDPQPAFDPAAKDGPLPHPEEPGNLIDRTQPPPNTRAELAKALDVQPSDLPAKNPPPGVKEERSDDEEDTKTHGADPVDLFTGEFFLEKVDFELPSIGFPFVFVRTYKSGRSFFGPFGYNWDHNYNIYLRQLNNGKIAVNTGRLQEDLYVDSGDSTLFSAPRGVFAKLERQAASSQYEFILTLKDGTRQGFARPSGWSHPERIPLVAIEDSNGNAQQLVYDNAGQLATVIDTAGRTIDFVYGSCGLLEALRPAFLQTSGSKPVQVQYLHANDIEHLSAVITMPTPDFPDGLMTSYEYDEQQPLGHQRSNITRVIDAKGKVIVENIYGTATGDANRVVKQYFMGGEYLFNYTNIRFIPPYDEHVNGAAMQVELLEPNRPLKLYTFNFRGNLLDERFRLCADGSYRVWARAYRYDKNGQLTTRFHPNGMAEVFTYDETNADPLARGNLLKIELKSQPNGLLTRRVATLTYEPVSQKVKTITDEAGATTTFVYDYEKDPLVKKGNLVEIVYPDATVPDGTRQTNCTATQRFDQFGQMIEQISPEGRKTTFEYYLTGAGAGLMKKRSAHDGSTVVSEIFEYDALGNVARRVDGRGNDTLVTYNLLGQLVEYQLPAVGGSRAVFKYEYNGDLKVEKEHVPRGAYMDGVIQGPWITHEYEYDVTSRLVKDTRNSNTAAPQVAAYLRDVNGNVVTATNALGHESRFRYDERNLLLRETAFATSGAPLVTRYSYDRVGNLVTVVHPDGAEEHFDYNENFSRLKSRTNAIGAHKDYVYGSNDDIAAATLADSAGNVLRTTQYGFDEKRRLVSWDVNGIGQRIFYDRDDCVVRTVNHLGDALRFTVDGLRRTVGITDPLGSTTSSVVDANDNIRYTSTAVPTPSGSRVQLFQALEFDERSRPMKAADVLGNVFRHVYDDRDLRIETVDAYGNRSKVYYDVNGLPIRSAVVVNSVETTLYRWHRDLVGRQVGFEDGEGNLTQYEYDDRNNLARTVYPDGTVIERTFNAADLLETERDPNRSVATYGYDQAGRLTSLTVQEGPNVAATPDIHYTYDASGRLARLEKGTTVIERTFDAFDRVTEEKQSSLSLKKIFDDAGNTRTVIYSDGREDLHVFDRVGRLKEIVFKKKGTGNLVAPEFAEGTKLVEYAYEGALRVSSRFANGTATTYLYDSDGKLSGYEVKNGAGLLVDREQYLYDGEKRRRFVQRGPLAGFNRILGYDALSRLQECYTGVASVAGTASLSDQTAIDTLISSVATQSASAELYTLTPNDRRAAWSDGNVAFTPTYNARLALSQLQTTNGQNIVYKHDLNGNRIEDEKFTYQYDAFDNLVAVTDKATAHKVLEQIFDAEGRIVEIKREGASTKCVFDGLRVVDYLEGQSRRQRVYGVNLDDLVVQSTAGKSYFGHVNDVNSLQAVTDGAGRLVQSFHYSAFGKPSVFDQGGQALGVGNALVGPLFTGRPYMAEMDLYEFRRRMYDPKLGAFLQPDVYNYAESPNPYLYCKHNPVTFADPTGTIVPLLIAIGILSAEGGLTALGATVVGGAIIGGVSGLGLSAARQHVQIQAHEGRTEFSVLEMFVSGGVGVVAGAGFPLLIAASPGIALVVGGALIGKGIYDSVVEVMNGHVYTAGFDLATTLLLPFAGRRLGNVGPRPSTTTMVNGQKVRSTVVPEVYSVQGDKAKILPNLGWSSKNAGRVWGMTEGSVYAHELPNAPRWMTMVDPKADPVILKFVGKNAEVFKSHETTGIYSLIKRALGQSKAGFGDLTFENAVHTGATQVVRTPGGHTQVAPVVELLGVKLAQGTFAGQSALKAMTRMSGRQLFDQLFNIPIGVALNNLPEQLASALPETPAANAMSPEKN